MARFMYLIYIRNFRVANYKSYICNNAQILLNRQSKNNLKFNIEQITTITIMDFSKENLTSLVMLLFDNY